MVGGDAGRSVAFTAEVVEVVEVIEGAAFHLDTLDSLGHLVFRISRRISRGEYPGQNHVVVAADADIATWPVRGRTCIAPTVSPHKTTRSETAWQRGMRPRQVHCTDHRPPTITTSEAPRNQKSPEPQSRA